MKMVITAVLLAPLMAANLPASVPAGEEVKTLPTTVVVATRSPRALKDVAASVTVISAEQIADDMAMTLQDLVRYEPAISVPRGSTRFGASNYTIRGIGGNRVAVEIDGVPISDQFDIGSFANAERDLVDLGIIQRIEILRGPASTLYGSNAIGGVVAYSTIDPDQFGNDRVRVNAGYQTDSDTLVKSLSSAFTVGEFGALMGVTRRTGGQIESAALIGAQDARDHSSTSLFLKTHWDPNYRVRLTGTVDLFERDVDSNILSPLGEGRFRTTSLLTGDDQQSRQRYSVAASAELGRGWADDASLLFYHQRALTNQDTIEERATADLRRSRRFTFEQRTSGLELRFDTAFDQGHWRHRIGYGTDAKRSKIVELRDARQSDLDGGGLTNELLGETFPVRDFPVSRTTELGIYVHDEVRRAGSRWTLIPALRYDRYGLTPGVDAIYRADNPLQDPVRLSDAGWSPKLGLLYSLSDNGSLFAQVSRGFRAPPFEDANIGLDIPLFNIRALPNPELESESSITTELGIRWQTASTSISATTHYTEYKDFIETRVRLGVDPQSGVILFQSRNIEAAHVYGIEVTAEQQLERWTPVLSGFDMRLAMAWTEGQNDQTGDGLSSIDPPELTARLRWQSVRWPISAALHASFAQRQRHTADVERQFVPGGYAVYDLLTSLRLGKFTLRGGVFNLSDKTYWRWSDVNGLTDDDPLISQLSAPGRNARVSLSFSW